MTIDQFNKSRFGTGDKAKYTDGKTYVVAQVDFEEQLLGLLMEIDGGEEGEVSWVRCENVNYIPAH